MIVSDICKAITECMWEESVHNCIPIPDDEVEDKMLDTEDRVAILAFLRPNFSIFAFFHVDLPEKIKFGLRLKFGLFRPVFSNIWK